MNLKPCSHSHTNDHADYSLLGVYKMDKIVKLSN